MRSQLVFNAVLRVPNRFELCQLTCKANHSLHRRATNSFSQTINEAFSLVAGDTSECALENEVNHQAEGDGIAVLDLSESIIPVGNAIL
jgi:hypothetical protein